MLVYKDLASGDELFTDSNKMKLVDDLYYEVCCKVKTEKTGIDESLLGANPSAEEAGDASEDGSVSGIDVCIANRLVETGYSKKDFSTLIKSYFKKGLKELEGKDGYSEIKERSAAKCKEIYDNFKELQFWMGEHCDENGSIGISWFTNDVDVIMIFFKFGITEEKF